jgi:hypothetical protein
MYSRDILISRPGGLNLRQSISQSALPQPSPRYDDSHHLTEDEQAASCDFATEISVASQSDQLSPKQRHDQPLPQQSAA